MGSWLSKSSEVSQAGVAYPEELTSHVRTSESLNTKSTEVSQAGVSHAEEPVVLPVPTPIKTKEELLSKFGPPTSTTPQVEAFFATCYEEDCFLMGGLGYKFTERMVWDTTGKSRVAYLRGDDVLKVFN